MSQPLAGRRVGLLTSWASRLGAGVTEAVIAQAAIVRSLGGEAVIFAPADKFTEQDRSRFAPSKVVACSMYGPAQFAFAPGLAKALIGAGLDCLHQQGIWMYPSRAGALWARQTGKPYLITPQGMLDPWIIARGRWKKSIAKIGYEYASWRCAYAFHALSRREAEDIRRASGRTDSIVIPNATAVEISSPPIARNPHFVFVGRVHPKKNVLTLVEAWRQLAPADGARLTIAGWGDDIHVSELRSAIANGPASVEFIGPIFGDNKKQLLESAKFIVLPTYSEGMPFAILEAWAAGTPTIMTRECNLPEGFAQGAAFECGFSAEAVRLSLEVALATDPPQWLGMARSAQRLATTIFAPRTIANQWSQVYSAAIAANMALS